MSQSDDPTGEQPDAPDADRATRKPYQKPAFSREQLFETMALACGKINNNVTQCRLVKKNSLTAAAPALMAEVLTRHGRLRVRALGSSMIPAIRPGDVLCIEHCTPDAASPGDVLVTCHSERVFAHRLVRKERRDGKALLVTRGDALWHTDSPQLASMLLGRVTEISRDGVTLGSSRSITWLQRLYGMTLTEARRLWSPVRAWVASAAAAALRTTTGSPSHST